MILPERFGIVYEKNFKEYFGPFAGRAFRYARVRSSMTSIASTPEMNKVNINNDSIDRLRTVNLVGEKRANVKDHLKILRMQMKGRVFQ